MHVLDFKFCFLWAKATSEAVENTHIEQWESLSICSPLNLYPLPRYPSDHCLMASEFYSGQLIFMSNLLLSKKVKLITTVFCHFCWKDDDDEYNN